VDALRILSTRNTVRYLTVGKYIFSVKLANTHFWLVLVGQLDSLGDDVDHRHPAGRHVEGHHREGTLKYTFMESLVKNYPYWHPAGAGRDHLHRGHGGLRGERPHDHPQGARGQAGQRTAAAVAA